MDLIIPGCSIKTFHRVLQCLSKFGETLSIRSTNQQLMLTVLDPGHSSMVNFGFNRRFFISLEIYEGTEVQPESNPTMGCQVNLKALIDIFKIALTAHNKAEQCEISLNNLVGIELAGEMRLSVNLTFPHSISQRFRLTYQQEDHDPLDLDRPVEFYCWSLSSELLLTLLSHFDIRLEEFTIICKPNTIQFLSHHNDSDELFKPGISSKLLIA
ncbi:hypothetical protein DSO57_1002306 [Entomophthora muscae]|uniref:Uncharacterized protein n=1 Tax=Entomophthora muscae TaxID=34485 RepID=A0ACC2UI61_9FUNG|nr:hypothetical protein DSO57_1002306 [Entomophthora muscae]